MSETEKAYLGDGAYVSYDGFSLHITAENGISATDTVVLGPQEYAALLRFVARVIAAASNCPCGCSQSLDPDHPDAMLTEDGRGYYVNAQHAADHDAAKRDAADHAGRE